MHILIVEDEPVIRQELKQLLENSLYRVTALSEFDHAARDVAGLCPDLILLDLNLTGASGFDICSDIRAFSDVPIIFVTSRTDAADELAGMLKGGDDYITKPFHPAVLLAHIAAVLKRTQKGADEELRLLHKEVELDLAKGCVQYRGRESELTKNELKILCCLFRNKGKIVSRMELIEYLWDNQVYIDDNTLSVNVTRIRSKLERLGICGFIETKRGMGYLI